MGFFDRALYRPAPRSEPVQREQARPPWVKPDTEVPTVVDVAPTLLARSGDVAVALAAIRAYSTGFEFDLCAVVRRVQIRPVPLWGTHGAYGSEPVSDEVLRVGLRFADESVLTNVDWQGGVDMDHEPRPLLMGGSSHSSQRRHDATYWVWPLPPDGPLTLVVEWPSFAVAETHHEIDARAILDASARVLDLWPGEPSIVDDWIPVATISGPDEKPAGEPRS